MITLKTCLSFAVMVALILMAQPLLTTQAQQPIASDPWTTEQTVQPADLVRELSGAKDNKPTVVYVGFRTLFLGGHIPGATFHGTPSTPQGLADLKKWAEPLPRDTNLVVYCGCCPLDHCPNLRPGFVALRGMGFTHLHALILPKNFASDWIEKGYPYEKGDQPAPSN
jgi:hypothetical protein